MSSFAERIRLLREEKGITQDELAKATELTKTSISRYENAKRDNPGRSELIKLSNYFNVSLDYLVGESEYRESLSLTEIENVFYGLSDENKLKAISFIKYLRKEQDESANKT